MKTSPLKSKFILLDSITFANAHTSTMRRLRKQEPSQMQLAFDRARNKAKS